MAPKKDLASYLFGMKKSTEEEEEEEGKHPVGVDREQYVQRDGGKHIHPPPLQLAAVPGCDPPLTPIVPPSFGPRFHSSALMSTHGRSCLLCMLGFTQGLSWGGKHVGNSL